MHTPIVSIVGKSGSGKTTLLEKLIRKLKQRGYRVAIIKHHSHPGFDIDKPGKDTWRHAQAGSDHVIIAAPDKMAWIRQLEQELTLDEIAAPIHDVDLILTEGYKWAQKPQIEVLRSERSQELISAEQERIAVASDFPLNLDVPRFDLDDAAGIADFLVQEYLSMR